MWQKSLAKIFFKSYISCLAHRNFFKLLQNVSHLPILLSVKFGENRITKFGDNN